MEPGGTLDDIARVVNQTGGYFVIPGPDRTEYVVMTKRDFDQLKAASSDVQLDLLTAAPSADQSSADAMLEKINRDIAVWQLSQPEPEIEQPTSPTDDLAIPTTPAEDQLPANAKQVKFEPLKGDLSPDLQE